MELAIRNKWISLGGASTVTDLAGNDVLRVKGKVFTFSLLSIILTVGLSYIACIRLRYLPSIPLC